MSSDSTPPPGRLNVRVENGAPESRVVLEGELDLASVGLVEERLAEVEARSPERIIIDLEQLTFIDSTGLRTLIQADARAREAGRELVLRPGGESIQRVFALTGTNEVLRFEPASA